MTTILENPPTETDEGTTIDICATLNELGESYRSISKFYREALRAVAKHYGSPYAAIRITRSASTLDERATLAADDPIMWEPVAEEVLLESQAENVPIARLYGVEGTSLQAAALATPVCEQTNRPIGALSLIVRCDNAASAKAYLGELAALVSLIATRARLIDSKRTSASQDDSALKRAIVKAADFQSLDELAFAVTNSLKNKFNCDQVTLGQVEGGRIRILSISGMDNVYPKSPGVKHIRQAMEECLDSGEVICCQDEDKWSEDSVSTNHRLHRHWHDEVGNAPVASVPLLLGDKCVAVLGMSRSKQLPFTEDELSRIRETVTPFAPAMMLVAKADRGLFRHATDAVRKGAGWLLAPRTYRRKAIAAAILASVACFCFATIGYEITVPSRIAPTEIRCFASPFEGTIKACHVEVGDEVVRDQLLYEMDTADLQLQRDKLESDLAVLRLRVNQALISEDVKSASLHGAEIRVVQAQLAITRHNLAEARVHAPSDGTVVSGELSKRIGEVVPMGAPLLEFVPEGDWSVELLVPETMADELSVGFEGRFACNARPGEPLECKITRIRPSSEPVDGKNVFIAEASVEGNPAWMRAGMEGVAQIDAGKRRVWWVALHRIIDYMHLTLWL
ncbi:MAG: HlyD family efflux transporter periplasmic adaptor subunit [Planctomycetota bacterium]|nr:HlyD family efflux transporter periplasmic adaptor subunit [Planctomycetota bacterium]